MTAITLAAPAPRAPIVAREDVRRTDRPPAVRRRRGLPAMLRVLASSLEISARVEAAPPERQRRLARAWLRANE